MAEAEAAGMGTRGARERTVAVIGAGLVGLSCALHLRRDGRAVTLIDPRDPGTATSFGNAGIVAMNAVAPLGMPGIARRVPGMLRDPLGPLTVHWPYLPTIAPWLLRLLSESRPKRVEAISIALASILDRCEPAWAEMARLAGVEDLLRPVGWLRVYETDAGMKGGAAERALLERRDRRFEILDADAIRQLQPALAPIFKHAVYHTANRFMANPGRASAAIARAFVDAGGRIERDEVRRIDHGGPDYEIRTGTGKTLAAEVVVLAAGAWSRGLAEQLGVFVPLDTERGYHLMLPRADPGLTGPVVHGERNFTLGPMEEGVRMTTQVEFAGLKAPPDFRRARALLPEAKRMLPGLETEERSAWIGYRPSLPDSKPAIGPVPGHPKAFLAFGHGHLGLTMGPATGRIVADLVAGRDPGLDLTPFAPVR